MPNQQVGVLLMLLAVLSFLFLPWLDRSAVRSIRYKGWVSRSTLALFASSFIALAYLGLRPAGIVEVWLARVFTVCYFGLFWLMPIYSRLDRTKPVPERLG